MGRYFGTDGFRGEANVDLTADHAHRVGRFLGWYYGELKRRAGDETPVRVVIGKDTRRSSYMLEYALAAGLVSSGADAYLLHVTTTPSVSYVARTEGFDCGIMISASHNPYYDNGIKLISGTGEKMDESTIALIEDYLDGKLEAFGQTWQQIPLAQRDHIGRTVDHVAGRNRYVGRLISLGMFSFKGMKVGLDCANGSAWTIAKSVFDALGAKTYVMGDEPDGYNINSGVGSTHIDALRRFVVANGLDIGFAYDGDADRCLCVDEKGNVVTGDMTEELVLAGADIVKVGIGPGSVCTTRKMTGVGYPQLSAVIECADAAHGLKGRICSDGGCTRPGDVAKAFGGGADFVMLGGMFAGHEESGGETEIINGKKMRGFYGMSSKNAMDKYSGGVAKYRAAEGKFVWIEDRGPVEQTCQDILGGVRSACTYVGAKRLKELTMRTTFVRVSQQLNEVFGKS